MKFLPNIEIRGNLAYQIFENLLALNLLCFSVLKKYQLRVLYGKIARLFLHHINSQAAGHDRRLRVQIWALNMKHV